MVRPDRVGAPLQGMNSVTASEAIVEAETEIAAQRGEADGVLILFVEKVGDAAGERNTAGDKIAGGDIESRVARVFKLRWIDEIAIGTASREVAGEIPIHSAPADVDVERSRVQRTAEERIAGLESRIGERIGRLKDARVVVRVVAADGEPSEGTRLQREVDAAGASEVGVEIIARTEWAARNNSAGSKTDHIAKAIGEVIGGQTQLIGIEKLLEANIVRAAALRAQRGIARIAGISGERLLKPRLFNPLAVGSAQPRVSPKAFAVAQREDSTGAGNNTRAETTVGFGAHAGVQRDAAVRLITRVKKACLVVAMSMKRTGKTVFHFIGVARGDNALAVVEGGLFPEAGTVELIGESWERRIGADVENARFGAHQLMFPMGAGVEIPVEVRGENLQRVAGCRSGRPRALEGWAGSAREAGVAANREAETIGVGKLVAEIAGEGAIEESVVLTLAIR